MTSNLKNIGLLIDRHQIHMESICKEILEGILDGGQKII